jgi:type IV pilus assembly protein PilM
MMFNLRRRNVRPIGVEIGSSGIKLLQLSAMHRGLTVIAAARQHFPANSNTASFPDALVVRSLRQMLADAPFVGRNVIASLPSHLVQTRTVRVSLADPRGQEAAAREETAELFPFPLREASVRVLHAGQVRQGSEQFNEMIVAAVRDEESRAFLQLLQDAGLEPEALQLQPLAVYRAVARLSHRDQVQAVVQLGASRSTVIVGRGTRVSFVKSIEIGSAHLQQAISRKLELSLEEASQLRQRFSDADAASDWRRDPVASAVYDATRALVEELAHQASVCLRYYAISFRGQPIESVQIVGPNSNDPHLRAALAAATSLPIETPDLFRDIDLTAQPSDQTLAKPVAWAAALGLCLPDTAGSATLSSQTRRKLAA